MVSSSDDKQEIEKSSKLRQRDLFWKAFVMANEPQIFRWIRAYTKDTTAAEEVYSSLLLEVYQKFENKNFQQADEEVIKYTRSIIKHRVIDYFNAEKKRNSSNNIPYRAEMELIPDTHNTVEGADSKIDLYKVLKEVLNKLPDKKRLIYIAFVYEEVDLKSIMDEFGCSKNTVYRIREEVTKMIQNYATKNGRHR